MNKLLKWVYLTLSIATLVIRFLYGTKYEMKNEEFNISLTGIILTLLAVIFFILFAISNSKSKSNDKNVE
jgi:hypothetical protein